MVRIMAGTLLKVGEGKLEVEDVGAAIRGRKNGQMLGKHCRRMG